MHEPGCLAQTPVAKSVRPVLDAAEAEIVRIGFRPDPAGVWQFHVVGKTLLFGVGHRLVAGLETAAVPGPGCRRCRSSPSAGRAAAPRRVRTQASIRASPRCRTASRFLVAGRSVPGHPIPPACISWSGRPDSNRRPRVPKTRALPGCATPRPGGTLWGRPPERKPCDAAVSRPCRTGAAAPCRQRGCPAAPPCRPPLPAWRDRAAAGDHRQALRHRVLGDGRMVPSAPMNSMSRLAMCSASTCATPRRGPSRTACRHPRERWGGTSGRWSAGPRQRHFHVENVRLAVAA